jgi:ATP-dependent RNA helicase SUPV3L1/SUV3
LMRRLRENTMLNTEIGKTGEVIVEGHVIGRLDGFTFAPDAAEAGSDAKALQATAQKALAGEIEARAEKLSAAKDDQIVLTSDGTIRWTGDAVAKLVAADDALHPRIRIIADERLAGAPREAVQTRLDLWLKTHIEKLLGPLFDLAKAEDVTGIARGIAFQLIEALGVLERAKIAAEMKDLDQPSRASLRKYGVRFGAYHIYVPALLKPAARALASLLWAMKLDNVDLSALSGAQHLAGSGRTSFPVDKSLDRDAYRVLGYKQCGERAVRVDILERLADLIRPALSWRQGSSGGSLGEKPAGAFDGRSFVVTQAMTSLTGSAGEDFASVLRALGYRMEKRPPLPPAPPPVEAAPAEAAAVEAVAAEAGAETALAETETPVEASAVAADAEVAEPAAAVEISEPADVTPEVAQAVEEAVTAPAEAEATETAEQTEAPQEAAAVDAIAAEEAPADASAAVDAAPAVVVPELVEVWRPGGRSDERRPRHDRNRHRHQDRPQVRPQEGAQPVAAEGEAGEGAKRERHGRPRRERNKDFRKPRGDAPAETASTVVAAEGAPAIPPREDKGRPPRERFQGKDRDKPRDGRDKGKFAGKPKGDRDGGRSSGGPSHRQYATSAPPRERERPIDPNSPFAKLAALKEQLTAGRKD